MEAVEPGYDRRTLFDRLPEPVQRECIHELRKLDEGFVSYAGGFLHAVRPSLFALVVLPRVRSLTNSLPSSSLRRSRRSALSSMPKRGCVEPPWSAGSPSRD